MKTKLFFWPVLGLLVLNSDLVYAANYYSTQSGSAGNYSSSNGTNTSTVSNYSSTISNGDHHHHKDKHHPKFSIAFNVPNTNTVIRYQTPPRFPNAPLYWSDIWPGKPIPRNTVVGGQDPVSATLLRICHAPYNGGVHPGKYFDGHCNISWGGREIVVRNFQVLVSNAPLRWIPAANGYVPPRAVEGGYENNAPLYVCQARYNGGWHPGKVVNGNCDIGWGGQEISIPNYNVLTT